MRVVQISTDGVFPAVAELTRTPRGCYYCVYHGQQGRGRWQVRIPLSARDFPAAEDSFGLIELTNEYRLVRLDRADAKGNQMLLLARGEEDGTTLVLWKLSPGFRGSAEYELRGAAELIALGQEAQGEAGRMGGAACPVILVSGPAELRWTRFGRLYGSASRWVARFDGATWTVAPEDSALLEDAVFA